MRPRPGSTNPIRAHLEADLLSRLGDALGALAPSRRSCIPGYLAEMESEDADALLAYLRADRLDCSAIAGQVKKHLGLDIPVDSLRRHRRTMLGKGGGCSCPVSHSVDESTLGVSRV